MFPCLNTMLNDSVATEARNDMLRIARRFQLVCVVCSFRSTRRKEEGSIRPRIRVVAGANIIAFDKYLKAHRFIIEDRG